MTARSRAHYLISYDICDPKRLRCVAKLLEGYGTRLQYSVFECVLDEPRLRQLQADLHPILNHEEDQVLFVSLGPGSGDPTLIITALGLPYQTRSRITII